MKEKDVVYELVLDNDKRDIPSPVLTIVTLCFNTGMYIVENMQAIKSQLSAEVEHVILDDCSTDDSLERIVNFVVTDNYPVRVFKNTCNCGISESFSRILELAKGQFISSCSDDIFLPHRISHDLDVAKTLPETCAGFYSIALPFSQHIDGTKSFHTNVAGARIYADKLLEIFPDQFKAQLGESNFIPAITACIRKSVYGLFPQDKSFFIEDYPFWSRLCMNGWSIMFSPNLTTLYRRMNHSVQVTHSHRVGFDDIRVKMEILQARIDRLNIYAQSHWLRVVCYSDEYQVKRLTQLCDQLGQKKGLLLILAAAGMPQRLRIALMRIAMKTRVWKWF
jgi:GT2 family glycosyltransferase